ncbi:hypothetical protein F5B20DRAFT_597705 [Whalleya microplaca]|nr:hypothetical protein F5B20DRAFT_597705 [Whalleya microplaca]
MPLFPIIFPFFLAYDAACAGFLGCFLGLVASHSVLSPSDLDLYPPILIFNCLFAKCVFELMGPTGNDIYLFAMICFHEWTARYFAMSVVSMTLLYLQLYREDSARAYVHILLEFSILYLPEILPILHRIKLLCSDYIFNSGLDPDSNSDSNSDSNQGLSSANFTKGSVSLSNIMVNTTIEPESPPPSPSPLQLTTSQLMVCANIQPSPTPLSLSQMISVPVEQTPAQIERPATPEAMLSITPTPPPRHDYYIAVNKKKAGEKLYQSTWWKIPRRQPIPESEPAVTPAPATITAQVITPEPSPKPKKEPEPEHTPEPEHQNEPKLEPEPEPVEIAEPIITTEPPITPDPEPKLKLVPIPESVTTPASSIIPQPIQEPQYIEPEPVMVTDLVVVQELTPELTAEPITVTSLAGAEPKLEPAPQPEPELQLELEPQPKEDPISIEECAVTAEAPAVLESAPTLTAISLPTPSQMPTPMLAPTSTPAAAPELVPEPEPMQVQMQEPALSVLGEPMPMETEQTKALELSVIQETETTPMEVEQTKAPDMSVTQQTTPMDVEHKATPEPTSEPKAVQQLEPMEIEAPVQSGLREAVVEDAMTIDDEHMGTANTLPNVEIDMDRTAECFDHSDIEVCDVGLATADIPISFMIKSPEKKVLNLLVAPPPKLSLPPKQDAPRRKETYVDAEDYKHKALSDGMAVDDVSLLALEVLMDARAEIARKESAQHQVLIEVETRERFEALKMKRLGDTRKRLEARANNPVNPFAPKKKKKKPTAALKG